MLYLSAHLNDPCLGAFTFSGLTIPPFCSGWVHGQGKGVGKSACLSALCLPFHLPVLLDIFNVHHPWLILSQSKWVRPRSQIKVSGLRNLHISAITHIMSCAEAWWGQKAGNGHILNEKGYLEQKSHVLLHHPHKHDWNIKTTQTCVECGCGFLSHPLRRLSYNMALL